MVVKPIALVAVAVLVAVGAGAGAYLAVRDNDQARGVPESSEMDAALAQADLPAPVEAAVDATEEVIGDEPVSAGDAGVAEPATPAARRPRPVDNDRRDATPQVQETAPAVSPPAARATVPRTGTPPPPSDRATRARPDEAADLPEVQGWERRSPASPRRSEAADRPAGRPDDGTRMADTTGETRSVPDQVALDTVDPSALGGRLRPEDRPPVVEELVIAADSVIGLQVDTPVSTDDAQVEDDVQARVTRDVVVDDRVAIPAGTRVLGSVVLVERAGQIKGASRLGVRFHTVVLDDVIEVPLVTETVYREGRGQGGDSAAKIGGAAVGGAILGAIFGGGRGAAIGGAAGAAGGTAAAMAGDGEAATLPAGATLTVRLSSPAVVTVDREYRN